jgi:hypothetical protein
LLLATALAAVPISVRTEEMKPGGVDIRSLEEVRWLSELPEALAAAIGAERAGREGIADVKEQFNSAGAGSSPLPLRRFIVAGVSARAALLAYEQGGGDYRDHRYHASSYVIEHSRWTQTREWTMGGYPVTLTELVRDIGRATDGDGAARVWRVSDRIQHIHQTHPVRRDGPLREANLSDEEVREIQAAAHGIVPDTLLNISGVVTGCPCEDGAGCSDQVWIVAYRPGVIKGLEMSRIGQHWAIGPVQHWWLEFDSLYEHRHSDSWTAFSAEQQKLYDRFPACTGKGSATAATSPSPRARSSGSNPDAAQ